MPRLHAITLGGLQRLVDNKLITIYLSIVLDIGTIDYHIRATTQMESKRYKHEGLTFFKMLPDDCVRPRRATSKSAGKEE